MLWNTRLQVIFRDRRKRVVVLRSFSPTIGRLNNRIRLDFMEPQLNAAYWDERYQQHQTGWDTGAITTPLKAYIDQLEQKDLRILVPGCGNGYEVEYLLQKDFTHVTVIDISPVLTQSLQARLQQWTGTSLEIVTGDFFEYSGRFDLVLEQTFFCALPPSQRKAYVQKMHELLDPGGKLVGVLFNRAFEGGPPFGGCREEYASLFSPLFTGTMEPCYNSIPPRSGAELFIRMQRKG